METAILCENLVKHFGEVKALNGLSFEVRAGEVFGLIGPNGAGKTTTLRIIATILKPTSGRVEVFGLDVVREAEEVRRVISYLPEEAGAYKNMTGLEYLRLMASLYMPSPSEVEKAVEEASRICGLGERLRDKTKTYSKGMLRRLLVARALMTRPKLAILDEPTSGLDVVHACAIRSIVRDYVREYGTTVLLSSHNMLEVEYLCDRVAVIHGGRILCEGTPQELKEAYGAENLEEVFVKATGGV